MQKNCCSITAIFSYDDALIGVSSSGRAIYDYDKMIDYLIVNEDFTIDDAVDWISYNTIRALDYMGPNAPIVMYPLVKEEGAD